MSELFEKVKVPLIAFVFFSFCAAFFYLGNASFDCTNTVATGPGDQTSGVIWLNSTVNAPLWGQTNVSNAPYGENLRSPVFVTGALQYFMYWLVSLFAGPVCGYNLHTSIGFVFSAMVMFFFVRYLTKRSDVAILAGFAATFTPYLQVKTGVHPSYVFYGVFVLAIWQLLRLYKEPTIKKAIVLGLISSTFFFIDPYFILLGAVSMLSAGFAIFAYALIRLYKSRSKKTIYKKSLLHLKKFTLMALTSALVVGVFAILPLMLVKVKYGNEIKAEVSSVRSDIKQEAFTYSARPAEYLLPNLQNPYIGLSFVKDAPDILTRKSHGTNPAENTLSLSYIVIVLAIIGVVLTSSKSLRKSMKIKKLNQNYPLVVTVFSITGLVAFLTSLPPKSHGIIFPSDIIIKFIDIWRVFARLQVVVVFSLAVLAAIGLTLITQKLSKNKRIIISAILILLIGFEYLTFTPLHDNRSWSYTQVHPFYYWLKNQKNIKTIAEYPLNENGQTSVSTTYFTDQYIHKKHLINAARGASPQAVLRNSLRDLTDPQTPSALAAMGVDIVVVHAEDKKPMPKIQGLELIDWNHSQNDPDSIYVKGKMWVYKVTATPDTDNLVVVPSVGFNELRFNSTYTMAEYGFTSKSNLAIINLKAGTIVKPNHMYTLDLNAVSADQPVQLTISQNGKTVWQGEVTKTKNPIKVNVSGNYPISLQKKSSQKAGEILLSELNLLQ